MRRQSGVGGVLFRGAVLATLVGVGLWARSLPPMNAAPGLSGWWPWAGSTIVTLYFQDGPFLFPVSRRLPATDDLPRAALQALLDGPGATGGVTSAIPAGVQIRSMTLSDGVARIDVSGALQGHHDDLQAASLAILETMTALPDVHAVEISVEGALLAERAGRQPLLYFASARGLVALPTGAETSRSAVAAYIAGPADPALTGLPRDVRLLSYTHDETDGVVSLDFSYTESVRALAVEKPDIMRFVLIGLTTSLTELDGVRAVRIDFEGRSRLGLGQCSDLLRVAQPRPRLLNDERLLGR